MNNIYKVAIIGAGSIGANKPDDIDSPMTENILTHAHAVSQHPRMELQAIVETDYERLHKAAQKWQPKRAFRCLEEMENDPDHPNIIIVSVPTEQHYSMLLKIDYSFLTPKLVIAEKPFCLNLEQAQIVTSKYLSHQIPIMVNYIRRFSPGHREIKKQIDSGAFGKALNCRVLYTRGMRHEGSHAVDLLAWFFGKCTDTYLECGPYSNSIIEDRDPLDPTFYAKFEFENCPSVVFQPCDGRLYGIFEIDICFEKCRIRLIDNGLYYEVYPINEQNEWGHKSLSYKLTDVIRRETNLNVAMYYMIDNAVNFLDGKENLRCTAEDAIIVHKILES